MTDEFDGYRKWLGIANKKRPPTHYELLAISLDEDDPEVIHAAAEQRRHYVETKRGDGHDSAVNEILYRIGEAELTLLNDEMRRDYDRQLSLFEKRRKDRQVDPFAPPSIVRSQPGRTVGEDSDIVRTFAGIMAIVCVGFGAIAWFSFQLPWSKRPEQPEAVPVVQDIVVPRPAPQPVEQPEPVPKESVPLTIIPIEKAPVAAVNPADPPSVDSVKDPDRAAAEWVLLLGGKVRVVTNGHERQIDQLPAGVFHVTHIDLKGRPGVTDAGLAHVTDLKFLYGLILDDTPVGDAGMEHLRGLTKLTGLGLVNTRVSDDGLVCLKDLKTLSHLNINRSLVSDAGLIHLTGLTNLVTLGLGSKVGDAGLVHLKSLPKLKALGFTEPSVSDAGMVHLKELSNLSSLWLDDADIGDAGLAQLKGLTNLTHLGIAKTRVSNAGLVNLKGMTKLIFLSLGNTQISNAGLEQLRGLTKLRDLHLFGTKCTKSGIERLKQSLPKCTIHR